MTKENFKNSIFKDRSISFKSKGVFLTILNLDKNLINFKFKDLLSISSDKESSIRSALKELRDNNYIFWRPSQGGWVYSLNYNESEDVSANRKENFLYIIKLSSKDEEFIKVGISENIKNRFQVFKKYGYDITIINKIKFQSLDHLKAEELLIQETYQPYKYTPKYKFAGYTECFNINIMQHINND